MADTPMVQQSKTLPFVFCGRRFLATEIDLIHDVVSDFRSLSLSEGERSETELPVRLRLEADSSRHPCCERFGPTPKVAGDQLAV
jgi:hypothetical protein